LKSRFFCSNDHYLGSFHTNDPLKYGISRVAFTNFATATALHTCVYAQQFIVTYHEDYAILQSLLRKITSDDPQIRYRLPTSNVPLLLNNEINCKIDNKKFEASGKYTDMNLKQAP
jgi:hypothetical protein